MPFHPSNFHCYAPFLCLFCPFPFYEHCSVNFSPSLSDIFLISSLNPSMCLSVPFLSFYIPISSLPPISCSFTSSSPNFLNYLFSLTYLSNLVKLLICFLSCFQSIMEPQQQQNQQHPNDDSNGSGGKGSFLCRQSSTRWTPTTDQIRILKDLYYNKGVRSPSADHIQRISAMLRQYGKIEGKNVFYWFQNHKARERQKKRFTTADHVPMQRANVANCGWKADHDSIHHNTKYPNISPAGYSPSSSSSAGLLTVGQIGNYGYGSMTMEKSFRNCSISACGSTSTGASDSLSQNFGWVGIDPAYSSSSYSTFFDQKKFIDGILEEEDEDEDGEEEEEEEEEEEAVHVAPHIKTLPLFPMHGEDINAFCNNIKPEPDNCYSSWYRFDDGYAGSRASLELSLNSYTGRSQD